jgi:glycosyltransferase involved in cell wall biosynthesis
MNPRGVWRLFRSVPDAMRSLDACVAGRRIHAVHSNTLAVLAGALWSRRQNVPHIWHVHEIVERPRLASLLFPWLVARYADRVVCNSGATRRWLVEKQSSLTLRYDVLHNGVADMEAGASPCTLRTTFRPHGQRLAIGLVGRINRMKGHAVLLDAAERLARLGIRDFTLVFIGSAPPQQEHFAHTLHELVAASPIGGRVVMIDFMPDLRDAYAALDIVCVPSTEAEAFGLVAVEAMAAGCAVVASRIGGLPEIVEDGLCGLLHRPGDAADLAEQLALLIEDDAWRMDLASAGRRRYESQFRVDVMTDRFMRMLASALGDR